MPQASSSAKWALPPSLPTNCWRASGGRLYCTMLPPTRRAIFNLTKPSKLSDAAGIDPFGDEDISVRIETGVVRVEKFTRNPAFAFGVAAEFHAILEHLDAPCRVFAKVGDK